MVNKLSDGDPVIPIWAATLQQVGSFACAEDTYEELKVK
jgi:hypothetical protein